MLPSSSRFSKHSLCRTRQYSKSAPNHQLKLIKIMDPWVHRPSTWVLQSCAAGRKLPSTCPLTGLRHCPCPGDSPIPGSSLISLQRCFYKKNTLPSACTKLSSSFPSSSLFWLLYFSFLLKEFPSFLLERFETLETALKVSFPSNQVSVTKRLMTTMTTMLLTG